MIERSVFVFIVILLVTEASFSLSGPLDELTTSTKISSSLKRAVSYYSEETTFKRAAGEELSVPPNLNVWIFFKGKDQTKNSFVHINKRALERRKNRGRLKQNELTDEHDYPVNPHYIDDVLAIDGVYLRTTSRWLNAISVSVKPSKGNSTVGKILLQIAGLDGVSSLSVVRDRIYNNEASELYIECPHNPQNEDTIYESNSNLRKKKPKSSVVGKIPELSKFKKSHYGNSYQFLEQINIIKAHQGGFSGEGISILVLDSGFNIFHESFEKTNITYYYDYVNNDNTVYDDDKDAVSQISHGTGVLSLIVGNKPGTIMGGAPKALVMLGKTESLSYESKKEEDFWVKALEEGEAKGINMVSSSLGYKDFWDSYSDFDGTHSAASIAIDTAKKKGVVCVLAVGNYNTFSITTPGDSKSAITVGSTSLEGVTSRFQSVGPTADGRIKPEVQSVGESVYMAFAEDNYCYKRADGTSFATPLVAGGIALILEAHPNWDPDMVKEALMKTASKAESPHNTFGWGVVNIWKAINYQFGECKTECQGTCSLDNPPICECPPDRYGMWCEMRFEMCENWCGSTISGGKCYKNKCYCEGHTKHCLTEPIPGWTCGTNSYADGNICHFHCSDLTGDDEVRDPDCGDYSAQDCRDMLRKVDTNSIHVDLLRGCDHPSNPLPPIITPAPPSEVSKPPTNLPVIPPREWRKPIKLPRKEIPNSNSMHHSVGEPSHRPPVLKIPDEINHNKREIGMARVLALAMGILLMVGVVVFMITRYFYNKSRRVKLEE